MLKSIPFYASLLGKDVNGKPASTPHVLLYGAIEVHAMGTMGCIASNDLLGGETGVAANQVRRYLNDLKLAKWIEYKLTVDNRRGEIFPLLNIEIPLVGRQPRPGRRTTKPLVAEQPTSIDNSIDNSIDISAKAPEDEKEEVVKISMEQVREIIDAFAPVNESYLSFYGKKTQYDSAKKLIKTYPKEHIIAVIKVLPDYNKIQYLASYEKIYTPDDLYKKWSVVKDNLIRLKIKKSKEKETTTILT